jgi:predicted kinase
VLVSLSGRSGVGKTTIARELARVTGAVHLRIDSIEQPLRRAGWTLEGEGYQVAYAIAEDNLRLGHAVVADCVNPWPLTRVEWRAAADRAGAAFVAVEIVCSDSAEHRRRVDSRLPDIQGHTLPAWQEVMERDYRPWTGERLVIDTARSDVTECVRLIAGHVLR